jgi:hypothetical protein
VNSRYDDLYGEKNLPLPTSEPTFDALHDVRQMWLCDLVVRVSSLLPPRQEAAMLHQSQVLGRHVIGNLARLGEFLNRILATQQHLDHAEPNRVRQGSKALRGFGHHIQVDQLRRTCLHGTQCIVTSRGVNPRVSDAAGEDRQRRQNRPNSALAVTMLPSPGLPIFAMNRVKKKRHPEGIAAILLLPAGHES